MNFAVKLASSFYIIKSNGNPQHHDISRSSTASLIIRTRLSKSTSHSTLDSWSISSSGWVDFVLCICVFLLCICVFALVFQLDFWSLSSSGWVDFVLCILSICFVFLSFCTCISFGFMVYFLVRVGWLYALNFCLFALYFCLFVFRLDCSFSSLGWVDFVLCIFVDLLCIVF